MVKLEEKTYQELLEDRREKAQLADQLLLAKAENQWLREQLGLAKSRLYAPSSEASPSGQEFLLFNEAEILADPVAPEPDCQVAGQAKRRKRSGQREMQLASLPIEEIPYTLPEEEQVCPQCAGVLHEMGQDERPEVKVIPAQFLLVIHKRAKYACRNCNKNEIHTPIVTAPAPETAFPGSLASPSSVAYIMTRKFVEGTPLYRQEDSLLRSGFELSRQTMANWMLAGSGWLEKIYGRMCVHLLARDIAHADETTLQVLNEDGRAAQSQSYMWLYRSGRDGPPLVLYEYQTTRASSHPRKFLTGFRGYLHVDGYGGYDGLPQVILVGCWSHARRKFLEALHLVPAAARTKEGAIAAAGLKFCDTLFAIERDLHEVTPEERFAGREARSKPVLDAFEVWLDAHMGKVLPKSALGSAIGYCRNQWGKLTAFLLDARLEIDNNRSERSIKPFVIGRKNWLFSNTPRGATASAVIYSIVETAKENGLDPQAYLTYLFEQLPNINGKDPNALHLLLPWAELVQTHCRITTKTVG
jgi:transposase